MLKLARPLRRVCVVAGLVIMAIAAQAFIFDGQISIDRALNSPTLTVRYTNANAAIVELRVNGESIATRTVDPSRSAGETTFTLNLAGLAAGENKVEIRLFDKAGNVLGVESTTITTENSQGPIFITAPKIGATVQKNVNIKVAFGREMKNSYVSFFIDNQFKSISNVPPYEFTWDTLRETNGWHEIEAWVVDDSSSTFKTRKVRVFVQNEGGRTDRIVTAPVTPKPATTVAPTPAKKPVALVAPAKVAKAIPVFVPSTNAVKVRMGSVMTTKPANRQPSVAMGPKELRPTGKRNAPQLAVQVGAVKNVAPALTTLSLSKGSRLPNVTTFAIVFDTQFVNFDVKPRVAHGVPLTPLRYLLEKAGGKVDWSNADKSVSAKADGHSIFLRIGEAFAEINKQRIDLEAPSFIDHGRAIVPLSFMRDALNVNIDYDKATGHVLITSVKK